MKTIQKYLNTDLRADELLKRKKKNVQQKIKIDKITLNIGNKESNTNLDSILLPLLMLKLITHQQPVTTKAKKSIANFKLRSGKTIGCKITMRNNTKINYLEKFVHFILPQIISANLNRKNNKNRDFSLGISDTSFLLELENLYSFFHKTLGMQINISLLKTEKKNININFYYSGIKII
jgi:large subunit ribosomal protein L5